MVHKKGVIICAKIVLFFKKIKFVMASPVFGYCRALYVSDKERRKGSDASSSILDLSLSLDLTFLGNGKRFLCLIYRLAINLSRTGEVLHEWKI